MRVSTNQRYVARIERVVDALLSAPADAHSLESLAALAHMSTYHFHRVYRTVMGETLHTTMRRVRLTFAAERLTTSAEPVGRIAERAGYESPEAFTRAFRAYTRLTPMEFRRRNCQTDSGTRPSFVVGEAFTREIDLVEVSACDVIAQHHDGPTATISSSFRRFWRWQLKRALLPRVREVFGVIYLDSAHARGFRYYTAVVLDPADRALEDVERLSLPGGLYARYRLNGPGSHIAPAFLAMQREWLPRSGFVLDARPLLERYVEPSRDAATELLLPVRR